MTEVPQREDASLLPSAFPPYGVRVSRPPREVCGVRDLERDGDTVYLSEFAASRGSGWYVEARCAANQGLTRHLRVKVDRSAVTAYLAGRISAMDLLREGDGFGYLVDRAGRDVVAVYAVRIEDLPVAYLPARGRFLPGAPETGGNAAPAARVAFVDVPTVASALDRFPEYASVWTLADELVELQGDPAASGLRLQGFLGAPGATRVRYAAAHGGSHFGVVVHAHGSVRVFRMPDGFGRRLVPDASEDFPVTGGQLAVRTRIAAFLGMARDAARGRRGSPAPAAVVVAMLSDHALGSCLESRVGFPIEFDRAQKEWRVTALTGELIEYARGLVVSPVA